MATFGTTSRGLLKAVRASRLAFCGAALATTLFPVLLVYTILDGIGWVDAPLLSFIVYGGLTGVFLLGHAMLFTGLFVLPNKEGPTVYSVDEFRDRSSRPGGRPAARGAILLVVALTGFNVAVLAGAAYNGFHYSESVAFCARMCHAVMTPELTAYENSPHSRVKCVECHIGPGAGWFARSKLSGARQLAAVLMHTYSRPIKTPLLGLRPARETCEVCHRPEIFHGDRLKVYERFLEDEANTHVQTILLVKVGSGGHHGLAPQGSHWHVSPDKSIVYRCTDRSRTVIPEVRLVKAGGGDAVFLARGAPAGAAADGAGGFRAMDCLDCHNRPTHIFPSPGEALDHELQIGGIPRQLPYIRKTARELITARYASRDEASAEIARRLRAWYAERYPDLTRSDPALIERAIVGVRRAYLDNVFPSMNVGFGTYERTLGHQNGAGCFRCHDGAHVSAKGRTISQRCDLCHVIVARDRPVGDEPSSPAQISSDVARAAAGQRL